MDNSATATTMYHMSIKKSNQVLNDNLLKAFSPFHQLQTFLGTNRFQIRNKIVTPLTMSHKLYTCAIFLTVSSLLVYMVLFNLKRYKDLRLMIDVIKFMGCLEWTSLIFIVTSTRFVHNDENVDFYLKMHQIDRLLKIETNKLMTCELFRANSNTTLGLLLSGIAFFVITAIYYEPEMVLSTVGVFYVQLTYMLQFLYFSSIMYYFLLRMRFINAVFLNHLEPEFIRTHLESKQTNNLLRISAADTHDFAYCNMDNFVNEFMKCFKKFQNIFRYQIFIFFIKFIFSCIGYIEFTVVSLRGHSLQMSDTYIMIFLSIIDISLISLACIRCEAFFREANLTRRLSVSVLSVNKDGPLRSKAKRILKVLRENPPIFSVFGMWDLKANTILQLTGIVTSMFFNILTLNYLEE